MQNNAASKMAVKSFGPDNAVIVDIILSAFLSCMSLEMTTCCKDASNLVAACTYRLLRERNAFGSTSSCGQSCH